MKLHKCEIFDQIWLHLNSERCKSVFILQISSGAFQRVFQYLVLVFFCKNRLRYSRERASQSLPTISQIENLKKRYNKHRHIRARLLATTSVDLAGSASIFSRGKASSTTRCKLPWKPMFFLTLSQNGFFLTFENHFLIFSNFFLIVRKLFSENLR